MPYNLSALIFCPSPKVWDFDETMLHWASIVREIEYILPNKFLPRSNKYRIKEFFLLLLDKDNNLEINSTFMIKLINQILKILIGLMFLSKLDNKNVTTLFIRIWVVCKECAKLTLGFFVKTTNLMKFS